MFDQEEHLEVHVTKAINLTKEAHDLYCSKVDTAPWDVAVPSGLLKEISNRCVDVQYKVVTV